MDFIGKVIALFFNMMSRFVAIHSSTLAWRIPWTQEPGRVQSVGSLRVGHGWATSLSLFTLMHWRRQWQPTPVLLPGESHGCRSLVGCRLRGRTVGHNWSDLAAVAAAAESNCMLLNNIVKAMVFPGVMYGCESWTIKKTEHRRIDALECGTWEDSWESLG